MNFKLPPVSQLGFGLHFCPVVIEAEFHKSWSALKLGPMKNFQMHPASKVLHYAQEIFEGLKVFKTQDKRYCLFRPQANIARMTHSAKMMAMAEFPEDQFLLALKDLSRACLEWIPDAPGALYLRPTTIATSTTLGVAPSEDYLFYIMASPVGGYFGATVSTEPSAIDVWISDRHVRAIRGGLGSAKTGANYAASLRAVQEAKKLGFANVLFLDGLERKFIEELSGMNFFIVEDNVLKTPLLGDTILAGVTRDSILNIAKELGIASVEENLDVIKVLEGIKKGKVTEAFACGTGASITKISRLQFKGEDFPVNQGKTGPITQKLFTALTDIQYGRGPAKFQDWLVEI